MVDNNKGFTMIELLVSSVVIAILAISVFSAYVALNSTAIFAKQKTIGTELATNQIEYLKSLPYDSLAVAGGAIPSPSPLPSTTSETLDGVTYDIVTSINYIDDAHDGCASYPDITTKNLLCRNLPSPSGAPAIDLNPADYKIANVKVFVNSKRVAELDTQIAARVAETDSTTGALVVKVIDSAGNAISGATVNVANSTVSPNVNLNDSTDANGIAIFYGLVPDTGNDYVITASKSSYSSLTTIKPVAGLSPNYSSQNIIVQQSSSVTMTINPKGMYSLIAESVDTAGSPIADMKLYLKGGLKKYSDDSDTSYYTDTLSPSDVRPVTDSGGIVAIENLDPGAYIFCGDSGDTSCQIGASPVRYLVAAVPYSGTAQIGPIEIPSYDAANPPSPTFPFNGNNYYQKVRLYFSTTSGFPRISSLQNTTASIAAGTHTFTISGSNLPCHTTIPSSCGTTVTVKNAAGDLPTSCIYADAITLDISCTVDISGAIAGQSNVTISANGYTLAIPNGSGLLGGLNVVP
jgi:prepilin-type N-terminal cleavage/methylation domain-containing protein